MATASVATTATTPCNAGAGSDTIFGGQGNDSINGGAGNDSISGDLGNDNIAAGAGPETISGGAGNDTIGFGTGDSLYTATGTTVDVVLGFSTGHEGLGVSTLGVISFNELSKVYETYADAATAAHLVMIGTSHAVVAAQVGADTYLFVDSNNSHGLNAGDQAIKLVGVTYAGVHATDIFDTGGAFGGT